MVGAEDDHAVGQVVEHRRARAAGEADVGPLVVADGDEIQVAVPVDLATREEEEVELPALGEVVELLRAAAEGPVVRMVDDDHGRARRIGEVGEKHSTRGDGSERADRHRLAVAHLAGDDARHELFGGVAGDVSRRCSGQGSA